MTVKARWFDAPPGEDHADPFAGRVERTGREVPLEREPALTLQLVTLVHAEAQLHSQGVTCAIKDQAGSCCTACPVRARAGPLKALCDTGVEQERVLTHLAVIAAHP